MTFRARTLLATTAVALAVAGCGGDGIPRLPISGTVSLDGTPVDHGQINFMPQEGDNVVSATIEDGRFDLPRPEGPSPGPHSVAIWSQQPTGKQVVADELNPEEGMIPEMAEAIPGRYNAQTELTADVSDRNHTFDFN